MCNMCSQYCKYVTFLINFLMKGSTLLSSVCLCFSGCCLYLLFSCNGYNTREVQGPAVDICSSILVFKHVPAVYLALGVKMITSKKKNKLARSSLKVSLVINTMT